MAFNWLRRRLGGGSSPEERRERERKKHLEKTDEQLAVIAPKISFAREPSFFDGHYQLVEVNFEKLMESHRATNPHSLVDMEDLHGYSPGKIRSIGIEVIANNGVMFMPAVTMGSVPEGKHRAAVLDRMRVKVVPVMVPTPGGKPVSEEFLEKFGVDKPYYKLRKGAGNYNKLDRDGGFNIVEEVDLVEPIDRAAIMTTPGPYVKHEMPVEEAGSGTEHRDRLTEQGRGQGPRTSNPRPGGGEGRA